MSQVSEPPRPLIHREIYERLRRSIAEGTLKPGDRIPSARTLATQMGIARGTVDVAYQQLAGEGYVTRRGAGGTFVSSSLPRRPAGRKAPLPASRPAPEPSRAAPAAPLQLPFLVCLPALDLFPRKLWATLVARQSRRMAPESLLYQSPAGDERLRAALANYLMISRGVRCAPEQIVVTGGYQSALGLIGALMLAKGDQVWVEDPGYRQTTLALDRLGATRVPVGIDSEGLKVVEALAMAPDARLCVVTPSNQFPLSVAMSLPRRLMLLEWAAANHAWIVEDDYDSEFYYRGRALPALKSLDGDDRVFYVGTFSKTLFPGLRLGYIVAPLSEARRFRAACRELEGGRSMLDQAVVADFLIEGHFGRHLRRMRNAYKLRRGAALEALSRELGHLMDFDRGASGLNAVARLRPGHSDVELVGRAVAAGFWPMAMSKLTQRGPGQQGLVLGLANIPVTSADRLARDFRRAIER